MPDIEKFYIVNDADMPIIVVTGKSAIHDGLNGFPHKHRSVHILVELGDKSLYKKKGLVLRMLVSGVPQHLVTSGHTKLTSRQQSESYLKR